MGVKQQSISSSLNTWRAESIPENKSQARGMLV